MNITNAKMVIGKMSSFVPSQVLNDFENEQGVIYHTIKQDEDQVVFQLRSNDTTLTVNMSRDAKPYDFSERKHNITVHYNGHIRIFTQSVDAEFYNDVLDALFSKA
jgi:hypothetical protein